MTQGEWGLLSPTGGPGPAVAATKSPEPSEVGGLRVTIDGRRSVQSPLPDRGSAEAVSCEVDEAGERQTTAGAGGADGVSTGLASVAGSVPPPTPPPGERGEAVLVVGDSMVRRARFSTRPPFHLTVAAQGGLTWRCGLGWVRHQVLTWSEASRAEGRRLGPALLWIGGNDVYPGPGGPGGAPDMHGIVALLSELAGVVPDITLVAPTPRPAYDDGKLWNETPAFRFERGLRNSCRTAVLSVGRRVCQWRNGKRRGYYVRASAYFARDGIHLAGPGYERLSSRLPSWLAAGAADLP